MIPLKLYLPPRIGLHIILAYTLVNKSGPFQSDFVNEIVEFGQHIIKRPKFDFVGFYPNPIRMRK